MRCSEYCMSKPTTAVWQLSASNAFKFSILTSAIAAMGLTTGCSSTPSNGKVKSSKQMGMLDANSLDSLEDLLSATDMRAVEGDRLLILKHGDVWKRMTVGFKMDENRWDPRIEAQRSWFISRQPYLDRLSARASRYLYHTVKEAERRGLPTELALLPIIESSYDPAATSSAAAAGMWQFIPSTGKIYGLRQTSAYDGRRDVVESTRAAYEFLGSLYNQFGSWELALAAYNAGPGRIQQAINRNRAAGLPTDYWSLKLPQETMNYVPRFLAVAQIIKSPSKYGVSLPPIANRPHFREVSVPAGSSLSQIAATVGLSRAELYQLNPGHRGEFVDASSTMRILIPADVNPTIDAKLRNPSASSGGLWAASVPTASSQASAQYPSSQVVTPSKTPPPTLNSTSSKTTTTITTRPVGTSTQTAAVTASSTKVTPMTSSTVSTSKATPQGSNALAAFASSADVPSAPRIPVAVTQAPNIQPVKVEPPISAKEIEQIQATIKEEGLKETPKQVLEPQPTQAEKEAVVAEIKAIAPQGTEIVDPLDGKIKLTAIQTSQSVAEQSGQGVTVGFAYPKGLAEASAATAEEVALNKDKKFAKTDSEVVVVPPTGKRSTYTVLPGDTLAIVAMKNGVNWRDIAKWNQVDPNATLYVGTTLYLYDAKPQSERSEPTKKAETKPTAYVVKPNDSLTGVAEQFGMSVAELALMNNLTVTSDLLVGQKLNLVASAKKSDTTAKTQKTAKKAESKIKTKSYTVQSGEYLKLIADRYAISNQELADLTPGLTSVSSLMVGQKINVPAVDIVKESVSKSDAKSKDLRASEKTSNLKTESYKVQSGDTLSSIATQSKMSLAELAELNNLTISKSLMVGQVLKVPAGSTMPESYTVQSGDSLSAIAAKYNLSAMQIANWNDLSINSGLSVGQKLQLNANSVSDKSKSTSKSEKSKVESAKADTTADVYVVQSGDTLANIAKKHDLELATLAEMNDLSLNSTLQIGQRLKVKAGKSSGSTAKEKSVASTATSTSRSKASTKDTESYTVKSGESLNVIASRVGLSTQQLAQLNDLNPKAGLQRGQQILVPKTVTEYKVKSGDNLNRLAAKYSIDVSTLAEMNGLKPNSMLRVGDTIKVPN